MSISVTEPKDLFKPSIKNQENVAVNVGVWQYPISLICMGAHKASAAMQHIGHQATSGHCRGPL